MHNTHQLQNDPESSEDQLKCPYAASEMHILVLSKHIHENTHDC